jgi:hypothetical protein
MAVLANFSTFRRGFADPAVSNRSYQYVGGSPATILDGTNNLLADGHLGGTYFDVFGTATNDGRYKVSTVVAGTATLDASESLNAEGPVASVLESEFFDNDGYETWPILEVRAKAFTGGFTGIPQPYIGAAMTISCNGGAADTVAGTDDYDWYLSQRTDVASDQYLSIVQKPDIVGASYSGTVIIDKTANADALIGSGDVSIDDVYKLFKYCHLYVRRKIVSSESIQWVDLLKAQVAGW